MAAWRSTTLYSSNKSVTYCPPLYENAPVSTLTDEEQVEVASRIYTMMITSMNERSNVQVTSACYDALKRYVCTEVFSECPMSGSVSYIPTCRCVLNSH